MDASIRFRIQVPCSSQIKKAWCYSNYHGETIRDLLVKIVNELRLDLDPSRLSATIDGFALIPSSEVRLVVRENDLITINPIELNVNELQLFRMSSLSMANGGVVPPSHSVPPMENIPGHPHPSSSPSLSSTTESSSEQPSMMITAHVDTDKRSLSPPWKKSIHPKSQDSSFRMETRDKKPYANHSAAQGKNAQDGTPTARNHSSSTVAMPSIIPTRRILTESAGDKDPIQLPLSLSKSKRKQALELIYRKRTHLKFPDSDEEQDGSTAKSFHTDDRRTNIPPDKKSLPKFFIKNVYIDSDGNETRPGKVRALRGRRNPIKKNKSRRGGLNNIPGPLDADNNGSGEKRDALCAKNAPPATGGSDLKAPRDDETPESNAIDLISKMKPISGPPVKDSVIGFRILQISENYTPEVSDLKIGKVISYDPLSGRLMIRNFLNRKENFGIESDKLLKPFVIADQQSGEHIRKMRKFEIADEGELNDSDMHNGNGCRPEDKYTAPGEPVALMYGDLLDVKVLE